MGTRHLVAVKLDGEYKVAQYGQWDGYPSGQGATVLKFLKTWDRPTFEGKLRAARFLTEEEVDEINKTIKEKHLQETWPNRWPELSRDTGAVILSLVSNAEPGLKLRNSIDFAADSLFCEWAYVLDLDANTLEVFEGFNHQPLAQDERFFGATCKDPDEQKRREADGYYPVRRVACYSLDALPTVEQMEADCRTEEEADEAVA